MNLKTHAIILSSLMIVLGYFMVSRWKFPSLKALHFRVDFTLAKAGKFAAEMVRRPAGADDSERNASRDQPAYMPRHMRAHLDCRCGNAAAIL